MATPKPLAASQLYKACKASDFPFRSTKECEPFNDFLGQERAKEAVAMAVALPHDGYNIFAVGTSGLGKRTMIRRFLNEVAARCPAPSDWCYVNNFAEPRYPAVLEFPAGMGKEVKKDMAMLWRDMSEAVIASFESEQYFERMELLKGELSRAQQEALSGLAGDGEKQGVKLVLRTPGGYGFSPMNDQGEVMSVEAFNKLPKKEQQRLRDIMSDMETKLRKVARGLNQAEEQNRDKVRQLNDEVTSRAIDAHLEKMRSKYAAFPEFLKYLEAYEKDVIENVDVILNAQEAQQDVVATVSTDSGIPSRYQVNVIVSNDPEKGAPVVFEDLPTHYNLMGHVEQVTYMGTVATDFTLIRAGALHRANGGFLLLEAEQVLEQPYAWQGLKRAFRSKSLKLSSLEQMLTLTGTISIEPDGIPFHVKVVLLGDRETFYLLRQFDPELGEFFKMRADFENSMPRTPDNERHYANFLADFVHKESLRPLDKSGVMRLVEEAARDAEDQEKLSLHAASVGDLLREANFWAGQDNVKLIRDTHIRRALQGQERRHERLRKLYMEEIAKGTQLFTGEGEIVGQVNGLTVVQYADAEFGMPSRISVTAHYGHGDINDIERDVDLGGAIHSKGVLILTSFLKSIFGAEHTLRFAANIAFEQSYGGVDGDSASLGELCGLLSAIGRIPIRQHVAITGSMNQFGEVQPIGGVNEKIEGFFAACQLKGYDGPQAVVIPVQNVRNLMLREDVLEAVKAKKFFIHAVSHVEEAIELLMGMPAGRPDKKGRFPENTVFRKVADRLQQWHDAEKRNDKEKEEEDEDILEEKLKEKHHPVPDEVPLPKHTKGRRRR
ncbi:MAG: putative ATP-dependent protease [Moraxellaceae bacterium]|jgi:lon-related putative ATP-dependent protease|nr:putative ATP-dependent protease [Moraxellaceae bacterium]